MTHLPHNDERTDKAIKEAFKSVGRRLLNQNKTLSFTNLFTLIGIGIFWCGVDFLGSGNQREYVFGCMCVIGGACISLLEVERA